MSEHVKEVSESEFNSAVAHGTTLVDFYADWCGPCRRMAPVLETVAKDVSGQASIVKVNIDKAQVVAENYNITSIPTLILFSHGKEVGRIVGARTEKDLKDFILSAPKK
jgi:thioredoxin 1